MNYGSLGRVIGHEITHSLGDESECADGTNVCSGEETVYIGDTALGWRSDGARSQFVQKAQCIDDQYRADRVLQSRFSN